MRQGREGDDVSERAIKELTRVRFMVRDSWEKPYSENPPDDGDILKFIDSRITALKREIRQKKVTT